MYMNFVKKYTKLQVINFVATEVTLSLIIKNILSINNASDNFILSRN